MSYFRHQLQLELLEVDCDLPKCGIPSYHSQPSRRSFGEFRVVASSQTRCITANSVEIIDSLDSEVRKSRQFVEDLVLTDPWNVTSSNSPSDRI
jgi:hypothetical protein